MSIQNHKELKVWQKSMDLVEYVYAVTAKFPKEEVYGLTAQLRRAAISIPSNIAEGSSKRSTKEFVRFNNIAYGSLAELETQLVIAERLRFVEADTIQKIMKDIHEIGRMINGLQKALAVRMAEGKLPTELQPLNSELQR